MARGKIKTEMNGTGGGRWTSRAEAKTASNQRRREIAKEEALANLPERYRLPEWRVACYPLGGDPLAVSGWYVRAEHPTEARRKAREAGMYQTEGSRVDVQRWKEPLPFPS
jgi:hypothetical protein